jgi:rod shape-determining protein MreD
MRAADLTPVARDVMKLPAGPGLIVGSLLAAFLFNALPWSGWLLLSRPDLVMIVMLFWVIHQPSSVGQGIAFFLGLVMDVNDSMLLGQHALAYVLVAYAGQVLRVRILSFPLGEQTLHVAGIALGAGLTILLLNLLLGADFPGFAMLLAPVIAALLWAPITGILYLPFLRGLRREGTG